MIAYKDVIKILMITIILFILLCIFVKVFVYKTKYLDVINKVSYNVGVDPYLILAIIKVESNFKENAISSKDAQGLMQIRDLTYLDVKDDVILENITLKLENNNELKDGLINLYNPEININIGVTYFNKLIKKYDGNYYVALLAYNAGMGNVDKWIKEGIITKDLKDKYVPDIPFNETKQYLKKVVSTYNMYKLLYY